MFAWADTNGINIHPDHPSRAEISRIANAIFARLRATEYQLEPSKGTASPKATG